jgi:hypothetical protein
MTVAYLGDLSKRASELFESSRADEKRQLMALVLSNIRVSGKKVLYDVQKPFDAILKYAERPSWGRVREGVRTLLSSYSPATASLGY